MTIDKREVLKWIDDLTKQQLPNPDDPNTIAVSEIARCLRKSYYRRKGIKGEALERSNVTSFVGIAVHKLLLEYLSSKRGYLVNVHCEYRLREGITLVGEVDAVGYDHILEIKTSPAPPSFLIPYHHLQVVAYMRPLKKRRGYVIYISKSGHLTIFEAYYSPVVFNRVVQRAKVLRDALINNYTPEREYSPFCHSCEYVTRCWVRVKW